MNTTITADGRVITWTDYIKEETEKENLNPDNCIPFEVCDCPTLQEYKSIISLAA